MICWIHGAFSSDKSFNYLRGNLPKHNYISFEYNALSPLAENIQTLTELLKEHEISGVIGHSLGGVMAALMVARGYAQKGVTIASPLGGFHLANLLPVNQLLMDVGSMRPIYHEIRSHKFGNKLLSIVASHDGGKSDGVVSISSQMAAKCKTSRVELNHFEVLLDPSVSQLIQGHLFG